MPQQVGSYGYAMEFFAAGFGDLTNRDLKVIITRPDGTSLVRLSTDNDVEVLDAATQLLGVRIKSGDWNEEGTYQLQVWDIDDPTSNLRSTVLNFLVLNSLSEPQP